MPHPPTPSQTLGPFPHEGWRWAFGEGQGALAIGGRVFDGEGRPVPDAVLEAWHPGAAGGPLSGLARQPSGEAGEFRFAVPRPAPGEPALYLTVFARGLLQHWQCAVFLADDPALAGSPLLRQVPAERRATLLAQPADEGHYRWDLRLQGEGETVFFDYA